jgi:hypothetical protein
MAAQSVQRTTARWGLTRPEVMRRPTIHFDRPRQEPPPLTSLVSPCEPTGAAWDVSGWGLHDNGSASCEGQQKIGQ